MRARLGLLVVVAAAGCNNPVYLSERRPLETKPAAMGNGFGPDTDLFVLPVRRPSQSERQALQQETTRLGLKMPVPWARLSDFDIEIEWSIKNLDATPVQALFNMNGGNEFGDYTPDAYVDLTLPPAERTPPPELFGGTPLDLAANEVRQGVMREDELHEAALDLEVITRYPDPTAIVATPFRVIEHKSFISSIGREAVPANDVTPAMVRFAFTLTSSGHVALDYAVRVRDHAGKLASVSDTNLYVSTAPVLAPPVMPPMRAAGP